MTQKLLIQYSPPPPFPLVFSSLYFKLHVELPDFTIFTAQKYHIMFQTFSYIENTLCCSFRLSFIQILYNFIQTAIYVCVSGLSWPLARKYNTMASVSTIQAHRSHLDFKEYEMIFYNV